MNNRGVKPCGIEDFFLKSLIYAGEQILRIPSEKGSKGQGIKPQKGYALIDDKSKTGIRYFFSVSGHWPFYPLQLFLIFLQIPLDR
jgi:hypothetical protein